VTLLANAIPHINRFSRNSLCRAHMLFSSSADAIIFEKSSIYSCAFSLPSAVVCRSAVGDVALLFLRPNHDFDVLLFNHLS
jgi:hypothetical protein